VIYETSCDLLSFRIEAHFIEDPGQSSQAPGDQGLALISCWLPNALWWTSQRLIVTATLPSTTRNSRPPEGTPAAQEAKRLPPQVPAQPFLFDDGWLAGVLSLDGSPAPSWRNGPLPLQWEGVGLDALAAVHFGLERHSRWLSVLAPRVHIAQAFADGPTGVPVSVTEDVHGTTLQSITLSTDLGGQPVELVVVPRGDWAVVAKAAPVLTGPSGAG
jgi:sortase A